MSNAASNFWPDFDLEVASPAEILESAAQELAEKTSGRLVGVAEPGREDGSLQLLVRAGDYSEVLLRVVPLQNGAYYPLRVVARALAKFDPDSIEAVLKEEDPYPTASSDQQLRSLVRTALQSDRVRASVNSLLVHLRLARASSNADA